MEKMTGGRAGEVCWWLIDEDMLGDISSRWSTERELVNICVDIFVNCNPNSSWEWVASLLYREGETAAVEEVRSYLSPRGRFS